MLGKTLKAQLILENGMTFTGEAFGYLKETVGEVVFYSGCAGYQETITDPALAGKLVVMTYPLVGNYGVNLDDDESAAPCLRALIVRESCDMPNNWRCEMELDGFLKQHKVVGLKNIDTRALTRALRDNGAMKGVITTRFAEMTESQIKQKFENTGAQVDLAGITCPAKYTIDGKGKHLVVIDLGLRRSMLKELQARGCKLTVVPAGTSVEAILAEKPDGVLVSSGAAVLADGALTASLTETLTALLAAKMPLLGTGIGYCLVAKALGCAVGKLKYGNHGASYSVKDSSTGRLYITAQNIGYAVTQPAADVDVLMTAVNGGGIEAVRHKTLPAYAVKFLPATMKCKEAATGFVYDAMLAVMEEGKAHA